MTHRTPLQIAVAAIPAVAWIVVAARRQKTFRGGVIAWATAYLVTGCAALALIYISN